MAIHLLDASHNTSNKVYQNNGTQHNHPPNLIDSDEEYYDSDEEKEHIMGPATRPVPLQNAIDSASKELLAKTLLEICEHSEASKELATALLAPSHAPLRPQSPRGTKRKASPTEVIERMCERCRSTFDDATQITKNCRFPPGKLFCFSVGCNVRVSS